MNKNKRKLKLISTILIIIGFVIMIYSLIMVGYYTYKNNIEISFDEKSEALLKSSNYGTFVYLGAFIVIFGCFLSYISKERKKQEKTQ